MVRFFFLLTEESILYKILLLSIYYITKVNQMSRTGNALSMRKINASLVRAALLEGGETSKPRLARETGLSAVTVGSVLADLVASGEALESGISASEGGRPAMMYRINERYRLALSLIAHAIDGQERLHVCVVALDGTVLYGEVSTQAQITLEVLEKQVEKALQAFPRIGAIGFGLPGYECDGHLVSSDLTALNHLPISSHFRQRCMIPILVENDVNAAVTGHVKRKGIDRQETIVYLYFPQDDPPGAGICVHGRLLTGRSRFAGEVACIPIGVDWHDASLYEDESRLIEAIARIAVSMTCVLNPDRMILHSSTLTPRHLQGIRSRMNEMIPSAAIPRLSMTDDFLEDFRCGVAEQTLSVLSSL